MNNHSRKLLSDVLDAANAVCDWCDQRTFDEYVSDRQFRRAIEREFEIVGEALARLRRTDSVLAGSIDHLNRVVDFRNRIIHGYDSVDDAMVCGFAMERLPQLVIEVNALLHSGDLTE